MNMGNIGKEGEKIAIKYLRQKGYKILATNYYVYKKGEIDIIALKEKEIIFVEVKTRKAKNSMPEFSVNNKKRHKMYITAMNFLYKNKQYKDYLIRYDIIAITRSTNEIVHFKDIIRDI